MLNVGSKHIFYTENKDLVPRCIDSTVWISATRVISAEDYPNLHVPTIPKKKTTYGGKTVPGHFAKKTFSTGQQNP
jgi:hypothetical protein